MPDLITTDPAWYYLGLISGAALLMTYYTFLMSGLARMRFKVPAPSHDGPEEYLRYVRAHQNTIEHLIMYLPGMWLFALAVSPFWAAVIGAAWPVARVFLCTWLLPQCRCPSPAALHQHADHLYLSAGITDRFYHQADLASPQR